MDSTSKHILQEDLTNGLPLTVVAQVDGFVRDGHLNGLGLLLVFCSSGRDHTSDGVCNHSNVCREERTVERGMEEQIEEQRDDESAWGRDGV